jgi:two-component system sensor histidine kinase UhpB
MLPFCLAPVMTPATLPSTMSLRFRLICLIAIVLIASLAVEGTIVSFNASRSVQTEMNSALQVGQQIVKSALARLPDSTDRRRDLEALVAAFKGNRHLRVSLTGGEEATVEPSLEGSHFGTVPPWFGRFLNIPPVAARVPIAIAGQDYGSIILESDPSNEILEVWNDLGDGFIVLALFFGLNILLIYFFIGRALRPLDHLSLALKQIGQGDYKMRIGGNAVPELSRLQCSFNRMASELMEMDEETRRLNQQLLTLQEEERREIARDLHDEISPFLFAVNADLASISRLANQGQNAEIAGQILSTLDSVSHMQRQIRTMLGRLRPGVLADFGLAAAITSMVELAPTASKNPLRTKPSSRRGELRRLARHHHLSHCPGKLE